MNGPATALVATLRRLQWSWVDAQTVKDDVGNVLVFGLDAPKSFTAATQASVRRWRLNRIAKFFPQMIPERPDSKAGNNASTISIDLFGTTAPLVKGKAAPSNNSTAWSNNWGVTSGPPSTAANGRKRARLGYQNGTSPIRLANFAYPNLEQHRIGFTAPAPLHTGAPNPRRRTRISPKSGLAPNGSHC